MTDQDEPLPLVSSPRQLNANVFLEQKVDSPDHLQRPAADTNCMQFSKSSPRDVFRKITASVEAVIKGQPTPIRHLLAAFASGGHVLLEDYPGTGKTTLAKVLARSVNAEFKRVQFTPDLLPSDILGVSVFDQRNQRFDFHKGPIFTNILLADEINRASPRTQSALLEAMGESQVSVEGERRNLSDLFCVIATQNPVEFRGTYPLPEAQMDRFAIQLNLGYVSAEDEVAVLSAHQTNHLIENVFPCVSIEDVLRAKAAVQCIRMSEELKHYIVKIVSATRTAEGVQLGASPRASITLMKMAQALAFFDGREFVTPDDVKEIAVAVIAHRIALDPQARFAGKTARNIVADIVKKIPVPA
jgi:MoxR-like ATPase